MVPAMQLGTAYPYLNSQSREDKTFPVSWLTVSARRCGWSQRETKGLSQSLASPSYSEEQLLARTREKHPQLREMRGFTQIFRNIPAVSQQKVSKRRGISTRDTSDSKHCSLEIVRIDFSRFRSHWAFSKIFEIFRKSENVQKGTKTGKNARRTHSEATLNPKNYTAVHISHKKLLKSQKISKKKNSKFELFPIFAEWNSESRSKNHSISPKNSKNRRENKKFSKKFRILKPEEFFG